MSITGDSMVTITGNVFGQNGGIEGLLVYLQDPQGVITPDTTDENGDYHFLVPDPLDSDGEWIYELMFPPDPLNESGTLVYSLVSQSSESVIVSKDTVDFSNTTSDSNGTVDGPDAIYHTSGNGLLTHQVIEALNRIADAVGDPTKPEDPSLLGGINRLQLSMGAPGSTDEETLLGRFGKLIGVIGKPQPGDVSTLIEVVKDLKPIPPKPAPDPIVEAQKVLQKETNEWDVLEARIDAKLGSPRLPKSVRTQLLQMKQELMLQERLLTDAQTALTAENADPLADAAALTSLRARNRLHVQFPGLP